MRSEPVWLLGVGGVLLPLCRRCRRRRSRRLLLLLLLVLGVGGVTLPRHRRRDRERRRGRRFRGIVILALLLLLVVVVDGVAGEGEREVVPEFLELLVSGLELPRRPLGIKAVILSQVM